MSKPTGEISNAICKSPALCEPSKKTGLIAFWPLLIFSLTSLSAFSQTLSISTKIDPAYSLLIAERKHNSIQGAKTMSVHSRVETTAGFAAKGGTLVQKYQCIVYTKNPQALRDSGVIVNSALPGFVTAWVSLEEMQRIALMEEVTYIEAPGIDRLHNDISVSTSGASLLHRGSLNNTVYKGKRVLVAIYDSGIDWDHFDFRDPADTTKSRILRIWDQSLSAITGETPPTGLNYGVEYTQQQINDELDGTPTHFVRERDLNGHGTHVAGSAAGNGSALGSKKYLGMAPEADLIIIKGGETSFSTTKIIDGITYVQNLATALGQPVVLNLSLGGQFGPHDGSRPYEVAVDNFTSSAPGRSVVISSGNDNGTNLHNRVNLAANASTLISFTVPAGTSAADVFKYRLYTKDNGSVTAKLTAPGGETVSANANTTINGTVMTAGFNILLDNRVDVANNNRYVELDVDRNGNNTVSPAGTWTLQITNNTASALTIDGWLYYKNDEFSSMTLVGGNSEYLVGSPGNAGSAITVSSFAGRNNWYSGAKDGAYTFNTTRQDSISTFSSRGPRRDGVLKPEITANGEAAISSLSSDATSFDSSSIITPGLYVEDQGTSMASPVVAGAVALLLQANPSATNAQIKNYLTSSATKDAMTELAGSTPNATWGNGKLDVFKAASAMFNCSPADHVLYKYDSSTNNDEEVESAIGSERVAVRFTPGITGKLAGIYFHTSTLVTSLVVEVRSDNAGQPGNLLGTINLDSASIEKYSWNYLDLSGLKINITSASDYFLVLKRSGTGNWSLKGESLSVDNRSFISQDDGVTWGVLNTLDFKIRSDVYKDLQLTGIIAAATSSDTRNLSTSNQFNNGNCALISQVISMGASPVSGVVTSKVWVESSVPSYSGNPFVARHYEITPSTGAPTATGRITLYFTQAEFNSFNAHPGSSLDLPANSGDVLGKSNLMIGQFSGVSSDGSGLPQTYTGSSTVINPADTAIVWNSDYSRWEVTFDVTGFSGFFVQTITTALPLTLEYFRGESRNKSNLLSWKVNCGAGSAVFQVERSDDGSSFTTIGSVPASQLRCAQPLNFTDASLTEDKNYYRIKVVENTGRFYYTGIILLQSGRLVSSTLFPTIVQKGASVQVRFTGTKGSLNINNGEGRKVFEYPLAGGTQSVTVPKLSSGVYFYTIRNVDGSTVNGKLFVR